MLRSRIVQTLKGGPAASLTRRRTQTWCSLFVAPCAPEGTPRPFTRCGLAGGVFSSCPGRVGYRSSAVPKWFSRSPLGGEQVLYRYPNRTEPYFSSDYTLRI